MRKPVFFLLIILNSCCALGQRTMTDSLQNQFRNYQLMAAQEKMFIHTDKTFYLAGETIWFKLYLVDAAFQRPADWSSIGYVEVLDSDHKPVLQTKLSMNKGSGNGYLLIPGFLNSGNYTLRGYTSWMRNFSPDFYFSQPLVIVNTLKRIRATPVVREPATIQFFPEGGHLLAGFSNRVGFKAVDGKGMSLDCKGVVLSQSNDTVVSFRSLHNGMGSFYFKPLKNTLYYAVLRLNDSLVKQALPAVEAAGFCMNVRTGENEKITVDLHASPEFENQTIYLFTQTGQIAKKVQVGKLVNGTAAFTLNKKDLGVGISSLTVIDEENRPVCERLIFKRAEKDLTIEATAKQVIYSPRSEVNLDLHTLAGNQLVPGNLSVSVFMTDALQKIPDQDIVSWFYLGSDLRGNIETPDYYFTRADQKADDALDVLLLTQGWRRFKWNDILAGKKLVPEFIPEMEGPVVTGRMLNKTTGAAVKEGDVFLSVPGADYAFNVASSDTNGLIHFAFKKINRNSALVVQPAIKEDSNYRTDLQSTWSDQYSSDAVFPFHLSKNQENEILNRSVNNQIENTYVVEAKRRFLKTALDTSSFYGQADKAYFLDDFVRYQTMEEVLREFVIDVRVRKEGDKFNLKVKNAHTGLYFEGYPLILIDGVPVYDATKLVTLDPLKIKKVEVMAREYYIGSFKFEGIINVKSYDGESGTAAIDPNATVIEYQGIQSQREFYSPSYATEAERQSRLPDFRNVLYWAPEVSTSADGKSHLRFYTSDVAGKFVVFIEGLSSEGIPGKSILQFEVKE